MAPRDVRLIEKSGLALKRYRLLIKLRHRWIHHLAVSRQPSRAAIHRRQLLAKLFAACTLLSGRLLPQGIGQCAFARTCTSQHLVVHRPGRAIDSANGRIRTYAQADAEEGVGGILRQLRPPTAHAATLYRKPRLVTRFCDVENVL